MAMYGNINYKEKLRQFNSTAKYISELNVLLSLCDLQKSEKVLDIGCGLGTAMKFISQRTNCEVYGYDVTKELYEGDPFYFRDELYFPLDCIYFMHSLAHIPYPELKLEKVKKYFLKKGGKLIIITPNRDWLDLQDKSAYVPDPTVVRHFNLEELLAMVGNEFTITASGEFGQETEGKRERIFIKAIS